MARNTKILLAVGVVVVVSVVAYLVAGATGGATDRRVADAGVQVEQAADASADGLLPADESALDETGDGQPAAPGAVDEKSEKPKATVTRENRAGPSGQPGSRVSGGRGEGQQGGRPAGFRGGGMGLAFLVMGIGRLEESGQNTLTAAQAKQVLALLDPLRVQKTLDQEKAGEAAAKIMDLLTDKQKQAMMGGFGDRPGRPDGEQRRGTEGSADAGVRPPRPERPDGEPRPPRMARPDGEPRERPMGPPDGAQSRGFTPEDNPLNPSADSPFADRMKQVFENLKAKSK